MSLTERGLGPRRLDVVERHATQLVLRMLDGMEVRGEAHLPRGTRPIDFLNREAEPFIAVTNATITVGGKTEHADFVAVNKHHLLSLREP
jgi:ribonucleotide monophosphatase NagD (HAD superfamily)